MRAKVHGELAGVAAGVRTDLAFKRPFVIVDTQMLLQTAAVRCCVGTVFALVRLLACVRAAVHVELIPPTEALVAQLTFERLLTWMADGKKKQLSDSEVLQQVRIKCTKQLRTGVGFEMSLHVFLAILGLKSAAWRSRNIVHLQHVCDFSSYGQRLESSVI